MIPLLGTITVVLALLVKVIGLPDQIRTNHARRSTAGLSTPYFVLSFASYCAWTLHGVLHHDPVVVLGQALGIVTTGILLCQIYFYRPKE